MNKRYRFLALTDHSGHSNQNSIYAILRQLSIHPRCQSIDVASRGIEKNRSFFQDLNHDQLFGTRVHQDFAFTDDGKAYKENLKPLHTEEYDIVLMRLPRPISDQFLLWLETVFSHCVIINQPSGIIATSNKQYLLHFPEVCPDMQLCHSVAEILSAAEVHPIVVKPLREYGGRGLLKIDGDTVDDGKQLHNTVTYLTRIEDQVKNDGYLAMKYLKNVSQGDKRILVVGGEILAASLRLPPMGSWLCNVAQGGKSVYTDVSPEEKHIITTIQPHLDEAGILVYGADTLMGDDGKRVLSEINTLSIGGFPQAEAQTGKPIIATLIQKTISYADQRQH